MFATMTSIAIRGGTRPFGIEAVGRAWLEAKKPAHHCLPFPAVGARPPAILQMVNQPVGHLMGNHLDQKVDTILGIQHRVEAQSSATKVCLPRTSAAQIKPDARPGQFRVDLAAQQIGMPDPLMQDTREVGARKRGKRDRVGVGQGGMRHEC